MAAKKNVIKAVMRKNFGTSSSRRDRRSGKVPVVVYGHDKENKSLLIDLKEWETLRHKAVHLVEIALDTGSSINALVKEFQQDIISGATMHVDFQEINMDEIIHTAVQIRSHGIPVGISKGGIHEQSLHEMRIACLPADLPESLVVDISAMELDTCLHVKDIQLPHGVKSIEDPDLAVFHVYIPKVVEEAAPAAAEGAEGAVAAEGAAGAAPAAGATPAAGAAAAAGKEAPKDDKKEKKDKK